MVRSFAKADFEQARARMGKHVYHTPIITSRLLSEKTGCDVRLKAELFQRGGSYKIRGPMNKFALLTGEQKRRGVICSSAGNHAQGVALAAARYGIKAVVVMACVLTFRDGLITEERRIYDFTGMLVQVGVLKAKPQG